MTVEELKKIKANTDKTFIEIEAENFENEEISNLKFSVFFINCKFTNCIFKENIVRIIDIKNCIFEKCEFYNLKHKATYIEMYKTTFIECKFVEIDLETSD